MESELTLLRSRNLGDFPIGTWWKLRNGNIVEIVQYVDNPGYPVEFIDRPFICENNKLVKKQQIVGDIDLSNTVNFSGMFDEEALGIERAKPNKFDLMIMLDMSDYPEIIL